MKPLSALFLVFVFVATSGRAQDEGPLFKHGRHEVIPPPIIDPTGHSLPPLPSPRHSHFNLTDELKPHKDNEDFLNRDLFHKDGPIDSKNFPQLQCLSEKPKLARQPKSGEMPADELRSRSFDRDDDGVFTPQEMEAMPSSELALVFKYAFKYGFPDRQGRLEHRVSMEMAARALANLSDSKIARVLAAFDEVGTADAELFSAFADKFPDRVVPVLLSMKESRYGNYYQAGLEGKYARRLLNGVDAFKRANLSAGWLAKLATKDAKYAANVSKDIFATFRPPTDRELRPGRSLDGKPTYAKRANVPDRVDIPEVLPSQYYVTEAKSFKAKSMAQAYGLGPTVALTLYDDAKGVGLLAHFNPLQVGTAADSIDRLLQEFAMRGIPSSRLEARIVGGTAGYSEALLSRIQKRLDEARIKVVESDILASPKAPRRKAIVFSVHGGKIFDYVETSPSSPPSAIEQQMSRITEIDHMLFRHPASLESAVTDVQPGELRCPGDTERRESLLGLYKNNFGFTAAEGLVEKVDDEGRLPLPFARPLRSP